MALANVNPVQLSFKQWLAMEEIARRTNYIAYRQYYDGDHPTQLTERQRKYLALRTDVNFCANYCQVVVDALAERLKVSGFVCKDNALSELIADWWRENRMDEVQNDVHAATIRDGDTFVIVEWDNDLGRPRFVHNLANDGTAGVQVTYSDEGKVPLFATKRWVTVVGGNAGKERRLNIYFSSWVEKYISHDDTESGEWRRYQEPGEPWPLPWVDREGRPLGIPVIHFRNKGGGQSHGLSELANVTPLQDALNKILIDYVAACDSTGFQMIFISGHDPETNVEVGPGRFIWTESPDARAQVLRAADMRGLKDSMSDMVIQVAGVSRTPQYYFQGIGEPPSGESLKAQETGLVSKAKNRQVSFGNSWEDVLRMGIKLEQTFGKSKPDAGLIECQWRDPETRNDESHLRTLYIKYQLGVPKEQLWAEMGYNKEMIDKMEQMLKEEGERPAPGSISPFFRGDQNVGSQNMS